MPVSFFGQPQIFEQPGRVYAMPSGLQFGPQIRTPGASPVIAGICVLLQLVVGPAADAEVADVEFTGGPDPPAPWDRTCRNSCPRTTAYVDLASPERLPLWRALSACHRSLPGRQPRAASSSVADDASDRLHRAQPRRRRSRQDRSPFRGGDVDRGQNQGQAEQQRQ